MQNKIATPAFITQGKWQYLVMLSIPPVIALFAYYLASHSIPHIPSPLPRSDAFLYAYHAWFTSTIDGAGGVTEQLIPISLYTSYLSIFIDIVGFSTLSLYIANSILFVASCLLTSIATRIFFDVKSSIISCILFSFCAPIIFFTGTTMKTILVVFFFSLVTFLSSKLLSTRNIYWSFPLILLLFIASIDRHNTLILLVPVFLYAIFYTNLHPAKSLAGLSIVSITSFILVSFIVSWDPGEIEPNFNAPTGLNFYVGNNEQSTGGYTSVSGLSDDLYGHRIEIGPFTESLAGKELAREEISAYWIKKSFQYIAEQPEEYLILQMKKLVLLLSQYTYGSPEQVAAWRSDNPVLRIAFVDYSVLLALATIGIVLGWSNHRVQILLLLTLFFFYAGSIWIFFVTERYKLPLYCFLIPIAAFGVSRLFNMQMAQMVRHALMGLIVFALSVAANRIMEYGYGWPEDRKAYRESLTTASQRIEPIHQAMGALTSTPTPDDYQILINRFRTPFYMKDAVAIAHQGVQQFPTNPALLGLSLSVGIQLQDPGLISIVKTRIYEINDPSPEFQKIKQRIERYDRRLGIKSIRE